MSLAAGVGTYAGFGTRTLTVDGSGPRFALLHGYTDSADTWQGVLGELSAADSSAVAVDLPGFGQADRLAPGPVMDQLDAFVDELVAAQSRRGPATERSWRATSPSSSRAAAIPGSPATRRLSRRRSSTATARSSSSPRC